MLACCGPVRSRHGEPCRSSRGLYVCRFLNSSCHTVHDGVYHSPLGRFSKFECSTTQGECAKVPNDTCSENARRDASNPRPFLAPTRYSNGGECRPWKIGTLGGYDNVYIVRGVMCGNLAVVTRRRKRRLHVPARNRAFCAVSYMKPIPKPTKNYLPWEKETQMPLLA